MFSYLSYFIGPIGQGGFLFLFTFPLTVVISHFLLKKKNISIFEKMGTYLFVFFFFLALGLVLFPFPDFSTDFCAERAGMLDWQFTPFQFIEDIQTFATKHSVGLARNKALFQVIFNILLISPLGFLGSTVFRWNFLKTLIFSFLIALFFELTQGTGVFGFFECPYRLFDVDDLMLNTSGAVLGFLVTLPLRKETEKFLRQENFIIQKNNFLVRRAVAYLIDMFIAAILIFLFLKMFDLMGIDLPAIVASVSMYFFYFVIVAYLTRGQTLGKKLVGLRILSLDDKNPSIWQLFVRSIIPVFSFSIFTILTILIDKATGLNISQIGIVALLFYAYILIFIPLSIELSIDGRAIHERMGKTRIERTTKPKKKI